MYYSYLMPNAVDNSQYTVIPQRYDQHHDYVP